MVRRQTDQWGVTFGVTVNSAGYEWREQRLHELVPMLPGGRLPKPKVVLAPSGQMKEIGPGAYAVTSRGSTKGRPGLDVAKRAFYKFRTLAQEITETGPMLTPEECHARITIYANDYGTLWGDEDARTVEDWRKEAVSFLDLLDVADALKTGNFREFESRIVDDGDNFGIRYETRRFGYRSRAIARPGEIINERAAPNEVSTPIDFYDIASAGTPRQRARMYLSRQVNGKLAGGLSLRANMLSEKKNVIAPHHLIHLLYMRLWFIGVDMQDMERETTCLHCGLPIKGTRRKKFCNDTCRTRFNNEKRAGTRI